MSEWDKLVSELDQVHESGTTLSVQDWFDERSRSDSIQEKIMRVEVELVELSRTLNHMQRSLGTFDARELIARLDETNKRLRMIHGAIAIQIPTFGYVLLASGAIIGVLVTLKYWF